MTSLAVNGARDQADDRATATRHHAHVEGRRHDRVRGADDRCSACDASEKIAATSGKVALRYGPLVYNIEQVDQDITGALAA